MPQHPRPAPRPPVCDAIGAGRCPRRGFDDLRQTFFFESSGSERRPVLLGIPAFMVVWMLSAQLWYSEPVEPEVIDRAPRHWSGILARRCLSIHDQRTLRGVRELPPAHRRDRGGRAPCVGRHGPRDPVPARVGLREGLSPAPARGDRARGAVVGGILRPAALLAPLGVLGLRRNANRGLS